MYKTKTNHKVIIHLNLASWKIQSNFRKSCIDHDKRGGLERVMKQKYSSDGRSKYTGKWIEREREKGVANSSNHRHDGCIGFIDQGAEYATCFHRFRDLRLLCTLCLEIAFYTTAYRSIKSRDK